MIRLLFILTLLWLSAGARPAGAGMIFWYTTSSNDTAFRIRFKPANCGFAGWENSYPMDTFVGTAQAHLIDQWGPPDEKVPDDNGGRYLIYRKGGDLKESFFVDKKGKIYSWQWSSPAGSDNMKAFVAKVESLAFDNDCAGYDTFQKSAEAMKYIYPQAAGYGIPLKPGAHFEPAYLTTIGIWYANGIHRKKDKVKAFQYYVIAAAMCDPAGLDCAGECYRDGEGTAVDLKTAHRYFALSSSFKFKDGQDDLDKLNADHPELAKLDNYN